MCGFTLKKRSLFGSIFERMNREMKMVDNEVSRMGNIMNSSRMITGPVNSKGFSIRISSIGNKQPKVSIKTFGDVKRKEAERQINPLSITEEGFTVNHKESPVKKIRLENVHDPESSVKKLDGKIVAEIKLPGVENLEDISIENLENSIEIKAVAGKNSYFKIITKPSGATIASKDFENGKLKLEIA